MEKRPFLCTFVLKKVDIITPFESAEDEEPKVYAQQACYRIGGILGWNGRCSSDNCAVLVSVRG